MLLPYKSDSKYVWSELNPKHEFNTENELVKYLIKNFPNIGKDLISYKSYLNSLLDSIGNNLPPIPLSKLLDNNSIKDSTFKNDVNQWINYTFESKRLRSNENDKGLLDWELIPLSKYSHDCIEIKNEKYWYLIDELDSPIEYYELLHLLRSANLDEYLLKKIEDCEYGLYECENDVAEIELSLNINETEPSLSYPFAWNTYWVVPSYIPIELVQKAGFIVYRNYEEDELYMGIDGCGYDFYLHHWIPLYAMYCEFKHILVETSQGPRYITVNNQ